MKLPLFQDQILMSSNTENCRIICHDYQWCYYFTPISTYFIASHTWQHHDFLRGWLYMSVSRVLAQSLKQAVLVFELCPTLCYLPTVAHQAPLSMGFSKQDYWSEYPFPSPMDLPDPGINPESHALQADSLPSEQGLNSTFSALQITTKIIFLKLRLSHITYGLTSDCCKTETALICHWLALWPWISHFTMLSTCFVVPCPFLFSPTLSPSAIYPQSHSAP